MTDNEIITALKDEIRRADYIKSYYIDCVDIGVFQNALDLINRLQIENKKNENIIRLADKAIETANAEIERLKGDLEQHTFYDINYDDYYDNLVSNAESKAIKEFAERLKEKLQWDVEFDNKLVFESDIDNLVKEMTE